MAYSGAKKIWKESGEFNPELLWGPVDCRHQPPAAAAAAASETAKDFWKVVTPNYMSETTS